MLKPGDLVIVDFLGAIGIKMRPAVVLSTNLYHTHRPDVIVGLVTTNITAATAPTDYVFQDWPQQDCVNRRHFVLTLSPWRWFAASYRSPLRP